MHKTICEGSTRSRLGLGVVFLLFLACTVFAFSCVLDGYWQTGTYGFLVLPTLALSIYLTWRVARLFWHHSMRGTDWIFYDGGRFHLAALNHEAVEGEAVKSLAIEKRGVHQCLVYRGEDGEELRTMPLTLSITPAEVTLDRARVALQSQST